MRAPADRFRRSPLALVLRPAQTSARTKPGLQPPARLWGTVMKGAKPDVERHVDTAIIAFKIPVMELVMEMPQRDPTALANKQLVEPGMSKNG